MCEWFKSQIVKFILVFKCVGHMIKIVGCLSAHLTKTFGVEAYKGHEDYNNLSWMLFVMQDGTIHLSFISVKPHGSHLSYLKPFQHTEVFWNICGWRLLKTMWQKEKLHKTSDFSFCHDVIKFCHINRHFPHFSLYVFKVVVCWKGLKRQHLTVLLKMITKKLQCYWTEKTYYFRKILSINTNVIK